MLRILNPARGSGLARLAVAAAVASVVVVTLVMSGKQVDASSVINPGETLTADDLAQGDDFGTAVDLYGDTMVVGSPKDDEGGDDAGAVYVYLRTGSTWALQAKLTASDAERFDNLGSSVAIHGNKLVAGAPNEDEKGSRAGAAYVFERVGTVWSEEGKVTASDGGADHNFGTSVDIYIGDVAVGALNNSTGAAYTFLNVANVWTQQQKLTPSDGVNGDDFGFSLAIDSSDMVVGAPENGGEGAVYTFEESGGTWTEDEKLTGTASGPGSKFGFDVDTDGTTIVAGAPFEQIVNPQDGAVYMFQETAGQWNQTDKESDLSPCCIQLGYSVSVDDDLIVAGSPNYSLEGNVHVFESAGGTFWTETNSPADYFADDGDDIGTSVGVFQDTWVAGAPGHVQAGYDAGAAYVFVPGNPVSGILWDVETTETPPGAPISDEFGKSVAVDGDYAAIGSPRDDDADANAGAVYIFERTSQAFLTSDWEQHAKIFGSDLAALDEFGSSVDIDGNTVAVGAPMHDVAGSDAGAVYVFIRSGGVWSEQGKLVGDDTGALDTFGASVSLSGDTLLVGAPDHSTSTTQAGAAYVFVRSGGVWSQEAKLVASDADAHDDFGRSVYVEGDQAVIGAPMDDEFGSNAGAAYVFERTGVVWTEQQKLIHAIPISNDEFGHAVAISGSTIVVGAPLDDDGPINSGAVHIFVESAGVWSQQTRVVANDQEDGARFGSAVDIVGDVLLAGAPRKDTIAGSDHGRMYLFDRNGTFWSQTDGWDLGGVIGFTRPFGAQFGSSVSMSADSVIGGAPLETATGSAAGQARVYNLLVSAPDISVTVNDDVDPVNVGAPFNYEVEVTNSGPGTSNAVMLFNVIPASTTFASVVASQGGCSFLAPSDTVFCSFGSIANGANATATIAVTAPNGSQFLVNTASVSSSSGDSNPSNNSDSEATTVQKLADLWVTKTDDPDPVNIGSTLIYSMIVGNDGPEDATGVTLFDLLPNGLGFVSSTGSCSGTTTISCNLGSIPAGQTSTVALSVTTPSLPLVVTNAAIVLGNEIDPNSANDTVTESTSILVSGGRPILRSRSSTARIR